MGANSTIRVTDLENDFQKSEIYKRRAMYNGAQSVTKVIEYRRKFMEKVESLYMLENQKSLQKNQSQDSVSVVIKFPI